MELGRELNIDVAEIGVRREMHSGGLVVLRDGVGLVGKACPGGLQVLERARR